jgi:hypothetical protein
VDDNVVRFPGRGPLAGRDAVMEKLATMLIEAMGEIVDLRARIEALEALVDANLPLSALFTDVEALSVDG